MTGPMQWWRARDPGFATLRRSVRGAVVVPVNFAIASKLVAPHVANGAQVATFAAFGSFALLLFVAFPGRARDRLASYAALAVVATGLISLGTVLARPDALAVAAMAVVGFAILFAGVTSSVINAGTLAALLTFILAVLLPTPPGVLPARLIGWGLAVVVAVPVAVFVWPPSGADQLRRRTADLCRRLAIMLQLEAPTPDEGDRLVAVSRSARALRDAYRTAVTRTAALTTGGRLLLRLVDELEWLTPTVTNACADAPETWPEQGQRLRATAAAALVAGADAVGREGGRPDPGTCRRLLDAVADLDRARAAVAAETLSALQIASVGAGASVLPGGGIDAATVLPGGGIDEAAGLPGGDGIAGSVVPPGADGIGGSAGEFDRPLYAAHELGYAVALVVRTATAVAAADSRTWLDRALGRPGRLPVPDRAGVFDTAQRSVVSHFHLSSVWLHNSIRGAVGLALAVLLARVADAQNAFWIGLGALSVLRSNALATGSTVVRALTGTVAGFAVGGALVAALGTNHAVLWTLLPLIILVAASAPAVVSFAVGQAAFTVFTIVLFNIVAPAGWRIGVVRVEDVALGCLASLVAGALFWPRGAAAALGTAYADAFRSGSAFLRLAIDRVIQPGPPPADPVIADRATAAGRRLDDALRQYLAEQGAKRVPLADVTSLANAATRLRLAGVAITQLAATDAAVASGDIGPAVAGSDGAGSDRAGSDRAGSDRAGPDRAGPDSAGSEGERLARAESNAAGFAGLAAPVAVLDRRADAVLSWYGHLATSFENVKAPVVPEPEPPDESFLEVVLPAVDRCGDPDRAARAERLLWSGQYLGDLDRLRADLVGPATQIATVRSRGWRGR